MTKLKVRSISTDFDLPVYNWDPELDAPPADDGANKYKTAPFKLGLEYHSIPDYPQISCPVSSSTPKSPTPTKNVSPKPYKTYMTTQMHMLVPSPLSPLFSPLVNTPKISHVAKAHGICSETLSRRLRGKTKSKRQAHEVDQMFTRPQELELVSWVQDQAVYPQQHELRARALEYLEELGDPKPKLDDHWVTRFVRRHPDLETKRKSSIAAKKKKVRQERKANVMEDGSMGDGS